MSILNHQNGVIYSECACGCSGSFKVFDSDWNELAKFHHRKEEISDIKFSPSECPIVGRVVVRFD